MRVRKIGQVLFETDDTDDNGDGMYLVTAQGKWRIVGVVGNTRDAIFVLGGLDALDECPLVGIEDIDVVPLEEYIVQRKKFARYEVARIVFGYHRRAFDRYEEIGILEHRDNVPLTFTLENGGVVAGSKTRHRLYGNERNAALLHLVSHRNRGLRCSFYHVFGLVSLLNAAQNPVGGNVVLQA